jgi:FkbM family methyltransferase
MRARAAARAVRSAIIFGSFTSGDQIKLLRRGRLYVDRTDRRGQTLLEGGGPIYPGPALVWRELARYFRPDIFLDVGANYGEVALSTRYASDATVYLFEPNPRVVSFLRRSISSHPDRQRLNLVAQFASSNDGTQRFGISRCWSGNSHGINDSSSSAGNGDYEIVDVPATTVDAVLKSRHVLERCKLQFKVDVEGFEREVMLGMRETLSNVRAFAGLLEFDRARLARARTDPDRFWQELAALGDVFEIIKGRIRPAHLEHIGNHTDLLVASRQSLGHFTLPQFQSALCRAGKSSW